MIARSLAPLLLGAALSACSVVGIRSGTEEPKYQVIGHAGAVEIRRYPPRIAAETTVQGSEEQARYTGFRRLAGYIFGKNHQREKIAMTAPVSQGSASEKIAMTAPVAQTSAGDGAWTIRFFMPAKYTLATLPAPDDPLVHLVEVPAEDYAVLRFSGVPTPGSVATETRKLLAALRRSDWMPAASPVAWFYDPPWTIPFMRRNEVAVNVTK